MRRKIFFLLSLFSFNQLFLTTIASAEAADELETQKQIIISYINNDQQQLAENSYEQLLNNFGQKENIPKAVHDVAQQYRQLGKHKKAIQLYQHITETWPADEYAMWAQGDLVRANIDLGNDAAAQTALDKLCSNFSEQERIADAVRYIGDYYNNDLQNPEKAEQLYRYVVEHWSNTEIAMWTQVDITKSNIDKGDDVIAKADIDKLVTGFSKHKNIARAIHDLAYYCRQSQKHEMANELDQYVLDHWPNTEGAMWAQVDLAKSNIDNNKMEAAQADIDKLVTGFSKHKYVARAVHNIACYYRQLQKHEMADRLDRRVLDHWPVTEDAMWARIDLVRSDIDNGNLIAAQANADKLIADFSDKENISTVVHDIACYYRQLQKHEMADRLDRCVINHWPATEGAMWAHVDLIRSDIDNGNLIAAQVNADKLITDFSDKENISTLVHDIAYYCRQSQKHEMANRLDRRVLERWPSTESAMWAYIDLSIKSNIDSGNLIEAQTGIDKLLANYSDNKHLPDAVRSVANHYRWVDQSKKADELDRRVVNTWPVTESAMLAQVDLIRSDIDRGKDNAAKTGADKLLANFSGQEHIATAVHGLAYYCREKQKFDEADRLDQHVLEHWPSTEGGMWAYIDLSIKSNIDSGNLIEAQAGINRLLTDYSDQVHISNAIHTIPSHYRNRGEYKKAKELYQYVIDSWPDSDSVVLAKVDMAVLDISSLISEGRDDEVLAAVDKLLVDFKDNPGLSWSTFTIGEEYYNKAVKEEDKDKSQKQYQMAVMVWQKVIEKFPTSDITALAYDFSASCYNRLGQYQKAIECYRQVVDNWPGYQYAWNAQFLIGRNYEQLKKSKAISGLEADGRTQVAYEKLLEKHAGCKAAKHAWYWLSRCNPVQMEGK